LSISPKTRRNEPHRDRKGDAPGPRPGALGARRLKPARPQPPSFCRVHGADVEPCQAVKLRLTCFDPSWRAVRPRPRMKPCHFPLGMCRCPATAVMPGTRLGCIVAFRQAGVRQFLVLLLADVPGQKRLDVRRNFAPGGRAVLEVPRQPFPRIELPGRRVATKAINSKEELMGRQTSTSWPSMTNLVYREWSKRGRRWLPTCQTNRTGKHSFGGLLHRFEGSCVQRCAFAASDGLAIRRSIFRLWPRTGRTLPALGYRFSES
jgi:hypothetical protein